jgi:hypothetical protein
MVDNTIATQVRPFQMPNVGEIYGQAQNIQLNRMRMEEAQETAQERNALRGLLSSGVDINTPEGLSQLRRVAPMLAPQFEQAAGQRAYQRAQIERIQSQNDREALQTAQTLLGTVRNAEDYSVLRPALLARFPQYAQFFRPEYSPELIRSLALGAQSLATSNLSPGQSVYDPVSNSIRFTAPTTPPRPTVGQGPGNIPVITDPERGTYRLAVEEPGGEPTAPQPATPARQPTAPAAGARVPLSQSTDILAMVPGVRRAEGTGQNPRSSAQGDFQFRDSTFIDQFRRNFPDQARGRSNEEILALRGTTLPDGRRVEEVLGPAYMQQNAQALTRGGFAATGQNVYLAHHFGATGAQNLLRAAAGDPNLPADRVLTEDVINANPFLRGTTVGQVIEWAGNAMDRGPGQAQQMLNAARGGQPTNAMAPGAAPRNVMTPPLTMADAQRLEQERRVALPAPRQDFRYTPDFRAVEPIPGSPTATSQERRRASEVQAGNVVMREIDRALDLVNTARLPTAGLPGAVFSAVPGTAAFDIRALLDTVRANVGFQQLNQMRQESPTGGALGNVTVREIEFLQAALGNLSQAQSPAQFRQNLLNLRAAFEEVIHGSQGGAGASAPPSAAAPSREQTPGPRREAAPPAPAAGAAPTLEQFLAAARRANPGATDQQLTDYYNRTYGGR